MTTLPTMIYEGDIDLETEIIHDAQTGERLTNDYIDQLNDADEKKLGLIPGGKSLNGDGTHSPTLKVVVSNATKELVEQAARDAGLSVSRWLRRTVEEKLAA